MRTPRPRCARPTRTVLIGLIWLGACGREAEAPGGPDVDVADVDAGDLVAPGDLLGTVELIDDDGVASVEAIDGVQDAPEACDAAPGDVAVDTAADLAACRIVASDRVPIPEASGAALVDPEGARVLLVADSGNDGRALILDLEARQSLAVTLPLGEGAGDDVEGLERAPDGRIFGLTSAGYLRAWRAQGDGFALALGPLAVSEDPAWVCDPFGVNCAANFEGLCLHPAPAPGACAGWAASKATGELVCLVAKGDAFVLDTTRRLAVTVPDRLSGCAFEPVPPFRLLVGGNIYSASAIWEVGPDCAIVELPERGAGNQEAILLLSGGRLHSFGDAQDILGDESPRIVFECR